MYHDPVLLQESIEGLKIKEGGVYVDLTFGGGGHTKLILESLGPEGRLFAFDQDSDAEVNAKQIDDPRFTFVKANFRHFRPYLKRYKVEYVDGILADLGISSHQIDKAERGFSTRFEADLDMRMDQNIGLDAGKLLNTTSVKELQRIFSAYGEIRNSRTLADAIVSSRLQQDIVSTFDLTRILEGLTPKAKRNQYFARVFQAIRIAVNDEMGALYEMLNDTIDVLNTGGRLVVIAYHSLEDRPVKNLINKGNVEGNEQKDFYGNLLRDLKPITRKPIVPSKEELGLNPRSRSAKLRIAEKQKK